MCIRAGENNLLLSGLVYGFRDPAHLRDSKLLVGFTDNQLINATIQSFTNQIQIVKTEDYFSNYISLGNYKGLTYAKS